MADSTKFRHKAIEVEGIECVKILQAGANGTANLLPQWVQDALFSKVLDLTPTAYAVVVHPMPGVARVGAARDWVLYDKKDDTINIIQPEILEKFYDVVEG